MQQRLPAIPAAVFILVFLGLGFWQLERLKWKEELLASIATAQQAEPVDLNEHYALNFTVPDYQRVKVTGRFDHEHEFYFASRVHDGQVGFHIVTPLTTPMGQTYLINRGWVPFDRQAPETRKEGQVAGEVTITGIARLPKPPSRWQPVNDMPRNRWYGYDLSLMYVAANIQTQPLQFYIEADAAPTPGGLPVGGVTRLEIPNNHLQYAITWFSLAGLLGLMFAVSRLRRRA